MSELDRFELTERAKKLQEEIDSLRDKNDRMPNYILAYLLGYFDPSINTEANLPEVDAFWVALSLSIESFR